MEKDFGQLTSRGGGDDGGRESPPRGLDGSGAEGAGLEGNFLQRASTHIVKEMEGAMEGRVQGLGEVAGKLSELGGLIETEGERDLMSMAEKSEQLVCEREGGLESMDLSRFQGRLDSFACAWRGAATGRLVRAPSCRLGVSPPVHMLPI